LDTQFSPDIFLYMFADTKPDMPATHTVQTPVTWL